MNTNTDNYTPESFDYEFPLLQENGSIKIVKCHINDINNPTMTEMADFIDKYMPFSYPIKNGITDNSYMLCSIANNRQTSLIEIFGEFELLLDKFTGGIPSETANTNGIDIQNNNVTYTIGKSFTHGTLYLRKRFRMKGRLDKNSIEYRKLVDAVSAQSESQYTTTNIRRG